MIGKSLYRNIAGVMNENWIFIIYLLLWPFRFSTFKVNWSPSLILLFLSKIIICKKKQAMRQWNFKLSNTVWLIVGTIKVDGCLWSCFPSSQHTGDTIEITEITHHHNFRPNAILRLVGVYLHAVNQIEQCRSLRHCVIQNACSEPQNDNA